MQMATNHGRHFERFELMFGREWGDGIAFADFGDSTLLQAS